MAMELEGKIVRKLNVQTGNSARGTWSKQEFVFEYQEGNYPSQVCMNVWGDEKVKDLEKYQVGDKVKVSFNQMTLSLLSGFYLLWTQTLSLAKNSLLCQREILLNVKL